MKTAERQDYACKEGARKIKMPESMRTENKTTAGILKQAAREGAGI